MSDCLVSDQLTDERYILVSRLVYNTARIVMTPLGSNCTTPVSFITSDYLDIDTLHQTQQQLASPLQLRKRDNGQPTL